MALSKTQVAIFKTTLNLFRAWGVAHPSICLYIEVWFSFFVFYPISKCSMWTMRRDSNQHEEHVINICELERALYLHHTSLSGTRYDSRCTKINFESEDDRKKLLLLDLKAFFI